MPRRGGPAGARERPGIAGHCTGRTARPEALFGMLPRYNIGPAEMIVEGRGPGFGPDGYASLDAEKWRRSPAKSIPSRHPARDDRADHAPRILSGKRSSIHNTGYRTFHAGGSPTFHGRSRPTPDRPDTLPKVFARMGLLPQIAKFGRGVLRAYFLQQSGWYPYRLLREGQVESVRLVAYVDQQLKEGKK
jgi:hypothetical protein